MKFGNYLKKEWKMEVISNIEKLYYTITNLSVKRFWNNIRRWFSYYSICRKIYDFDYSSILAVERYQIERVRDSIIHYHNHVNWERDVRQMNLALKLLDIIEENGCSKRIGKPVEFEKIEGKELYRLVPDPDEYWTIPVYVNTRNYKRFWNDFDDSNFNDKSSSNLWKDHLRVQKAWYLYYKVREQYTRNWWD